MLFDYALAQAIEQGKQDPPAPEIDRKSIAVLPFENLSDAISKPTHRWDPGRDSDPIRQIAV